MKLFPFFVVLTLVASVLPAPVQAADVYANILVDYTSNILTPSNAVGAPDGAYADFRTIDTELVLDMGEGEEGTGDLTLYFEMFDYGARVNVTFRDAELNVLYDTGIGLPGMTNVESVIYPYDSSYRYVYIESARTNQWSLDAVAAAGYESQEETTEETPADEAEPPTVEDTTGMLIKLADRSSVYMLGSDGKRHAFPSEDVFFSWYADFDSVTEIDAVTMASYGLGKNVTMRPGTSLVKITTDPKTYAVEPGGILRWVTTEELAVNLYGDNWNQRVVDVADTFWLNYSLGDDVEAAVHPDGTIIEDSNGAFWYIENGNRLEISTEDFANMDFASNFLVTDAENYLDLYVDGGAFELTNENRYP